MCKKCCNSFYCTIYFILLDTKPRSYIRRLVRFVAYRYSTWICLLTWWVRCCIQWRHWCLDVNDYRKRTCRSHGNGCHGNGCYVNDCCHIISGCGGASKRWFGVHILTELAVIPVITDAFKRSRLWDAVRHVLSTWPKGPFTPTDSVAFKMRVNVTRRLA